MLEHLFKLIWNDRKRFLGVFIEQMLVFVILMFCIVSISITVEEYHKPGVLDTEDVVFFGYNIATYQSDTDLNEVSRNMDVLIENLRKRSNVKAITESLHLAQGFNVGNRRSDSITILKTKMKVQIKGTDKYAMSVYAPELIEGNWITDSKLSDGSRPIVITKDIADTLRWNKSVGKKLDLWNQDFTIVGVVSGLKNKVLHPSVPTVVVPIEMVRGNRYREIAAKVDNVDGFSNDFFREWKKTITSKDVSPVLINLDITRKISMFGQIMGILLQTIPTLFLLVFAFIGTFGVFWLNSQKRIKEFALRIALGSTPRQLVKLVMVESAIISIISMLPGLLLSIFIYENEFTIVHIIAIGITVILMLLFSIFSAWYPAYTVSKINPAKAIKYE